jgi:alkanesulfonate monooxygenase SsuD/methylene tetrahydromethanopterin reductase-like flavin-dependent oxidoreductase (luciferase family)
VQAGASEDGKAFAAHYGEMIFVTPFSLETAQATYKDIKEKAASYGRDPDQIKIMPGLAPVIGKTEAEAKEKFEELQSLLSVPVTLNILGIRMGGMDLTGLNVDEPLPEGLPTTPRTQRQYKMMLERTRNEGLTLRQLALKQSGSLAGLSVHGSVTQIADMMEEWFRSGACDGFNLQPATFPGVFGDVVELLVPELRRRGLFRTEYEGRTLRENLGLSRPPSRYATN